MKLNVKIEFSIEGEETLDQEELRQMIYNFLAEAIESEELEYNIETDEEDLN